MLWMPELGRMGAAFNLEPEAALFPGNPYFSGIYTLRDAGLIKDRTRDYATVPSQELLC